MSLLRAADDHLSHQTARPVMEPVTDSIKFMERIHFPLLSTDGQHVVDVGFGQHPNRDRMEAFAGLTSGTDVRFVRGLRDWRPNVDDISVGPIHWEVIEGLKRMRCTLDDNEAGIAWELEFEGRFPPSLVEPHVHAEGSVAADEHTRFYQMGRITGWFSVDGVRTEVTEDSFRGNRDRSWGVRQPFGDPDAASFDGPRIVDFLQGMYLFAYIQFEDWALEFMRIEGPDGTQLFDVSQRYYPDRVEYLPGVVRHTASFARPDGMVLKDGTIVFGLPEGGELEVAYESTGTWFPLGAIGGYHPWRNFLQGRNMGSDWLETGRLDLADADTIGDVRGLTDTSCRVTCNGESGFAIIECWPWATYHPYGIKP